MIRLTYAPDLLEEAVLLAERKAPPDEARTFRCERDRIYECPESDVREARFASLHLRWFAHFALHRVIEQVVGERTDIADRVAGARVLRTLTRQDEGADLIDAASVALGGDPRPTLVLRLRATTLVEPAALRALLLHELTHVADMLDPAFGYERTLPASDQGPSGDNILRDRYRVLWDVTIDGRLARAGEASGRLREARWREFAGTFAMLGERCQDAFDEWFDRIRPTHRVLATFVLAPSVSGSTNDRASGRCPLCRFPVAALAPQSERLSAAVQATIRAHHPGWRIERGLCVQCLDLYEARYEETLGVGR
jgi:hypothetical protein